MIVINNFKVVAWAITFLNFFKILSWSKHKRLNFEKIESNFQKLTKNSHTHPIDFYWGSPVLMDSHLSQQQAG